MISFVSYVSLVSNNDPVKNRTNTKEAIAACFVNPDLDEARQARDAARVFAASGPAQGQVRSLRISAEKGSSRSVVVPESAFRLFLEVLNQMAQGNAVTLVPTHHELTTQQAADLLGVSRPYFVKLLEAKAIPHHRVGSRRRVKFEHLIAYLGKMKGESNEALAALAKQSQELGMGY